MCILLGILFLIFIIIVTNYMGNCDEEMRADKMYLFREPLDSLEDENED